MEVVSYRLRVRVAVPKYRPQQESPRKSPPPVREAEKGVRALHLSADAAIEATLYERDRLEVGSVIAGPAIVEQFDATTVIPPCWMGTVDGYRNLMLERNGP